MTPPRPVAALGEAAAAAVTPVAGAAAPARSPTLAEEDAAASRKRAEAAAEAAARRTAEAARRARDAAAALAALQMRACERAPRDACAPASLVANAGAEPESGPGSSRQASTDLSEAPATAPDELAEVLAFVARELEALASDNAARGGGGGGGGGTAELSASRAAEITHSAALKLVAEYAGRGGFFGARPAAANAPAAREPEPHRRDKVRRLLLRYLENEGRRGRRGR